MRALLIAEKPSLKDTIQKVYNKYRNVFPDTIDFACFHGHIVGLVEPRDYGIEAWTGTWNWEMLPINPQKFKTYPTDKKTVQDLRNKIENGNYDYLINACDPEREGNHIFQLFYSLIDCKLPCKRFWTTDLSDNKVQESLLNLRYDNDGKLPNMRNLTNAALLRGRFDWLVGMNITIAASLAMGETAKIGRVKTPTLSIVAKREEEIANFKPTTRYELNCVYKENFVGTLFDENGNISFDSPNGFNDIKNQLGSTAIVTKVEKKKEEKKAPALYNLSALQLDAEKEFGYSIEDTLATAQSLYEKKVLSYPRTDCTVVGSDTAKDFNYLLKTVSSLPHLKNQVDKLAPNACQLVVSNKTYVNDAKLAESGHYALIPTREIPQWNTLTPMEQNVLELVYRRFVAIFMPPLVVDKVEVVTTNNGFNFKSSGKTVISKGWQELYNVDSKDVILPPLNKGDMVNVAKFETKEKTTKCPKRYTPGELITVMKNPVSFLEDETLKSIMKDVKGIGTEATRTHIIQELSDNSKGKKPYIEIKKGKGKSDLIYVTPLGMNLYYNYKDFDFSKVDMTGNWETKLEQVEKGTLSPQQFDKEMREYVLSCIDTIQQSKTIKRISRSDLVEPLGQCPCCNIANVVEGKSYYLCQKYKNGCDFILAKEMYGNKITKTEVKKILSGKKTKEYTMKYKDKTSGEMKEWNACLEFNKETKKVEFAKKEKKNSNGVQWEANGSSMGIMCPKCKKNEIIYHGNCCKCEGESPCGWFMSANLKGAIFSKEDMLSLLNGNIVSKKFTWTSGKSSEANVKFENERIQFIFPEKK